MIREFTQEEIEALDLPYDYNNDCVVEKTFLESWRWGEVYSLIFWFEGDTYETSYRTASGDSELDFEDMWYGFPVKAAKVARFEIISHEWREVD